FSDGAVHKYFNPYDTPYEAFINYMNVLSDFILRVDDAISVSDVNFAPSKVAAPAKKVAKKAPAKKAAAPKAAAKKAEPKAKKPAATKTAKK
ncbi:MAG: alpha-amylase, partial [Bacteroidales bacterium]|nr:alpha-amylase [Bacteroidales bacterium]